MQRLCSARVAAASAVRTSISRRALARQTSTISASAWHAPHCAVRSFAVAASASAPATPSSSSSSSSSAASPLPASSPLAGLAPDLLALASGVLAGDRLSLSRAITLVESSHPRHIAQAQQLLEALAHERERKVKVAEAAQTDAGAPKQLSKEEADQAALRKKRTLRIGISGPPGVGKSTFIEHLGKYLISLGHRLAVLSIDPSSHITGGSILGDKTRMMELSRHPNAYVRPSPSKCVLGGVAAHTFDGILLCEHAGFDLVLIETVGVGQSEVSVGDMVDLLVLLVQPGGGDELQGMKKGIVEMIDMIIVNKADGALEPNARHTKLEYMHALQLSAGRKKDTDWKPVVKLCSSVNETTGSTDADQATVAAAPGTAATAQQRQHAQLQDIWRTICDFEEWSKGPYGDFLARRARQSHALLLQALNDNVYARLLNALPSLPTFRAVRDQLNKQAASRAKSSIAASAASEVIPRVAAQAIVDEWITQESKQVTLKAEANKST